MEKLIKLPGGSWVDPAEVVAITGGNRAVVTYLAGDRSAADHVGDDVGADEYERLVDDTAHAVNDALAERAKESIASLYERLKTPAEPNGSPPEWAGKGKAGEVPTARAKKAAGPDPRAVGEMVYTYVGTVDGVDGLLDLVDTIVNGVGPEPAADAPGPPARNFPVYSTVRLKSGGPDMMLLHYINDNEVRCQWFDGGQAQSQLFRVDTLRPAKP